MWSLLFSEFGLKSKFILYAVFLHKPHIWEKSGSGDTGQYALANQIVGLTISLEQNYEIAWFFAC